MPATPKCRKIKMNEWDGVHPGCHSSLPILGTNKRTQESSPDHDHTYKINIHCHSIPEIQVSLSTSSFFFFCFFLFFVLIVLIGEMTFTASMIFTLGAPTLCPAPQNLQSALLHSLHPVSRR